MRITNIKKVGIIGVGLIGGSIALALKRKMQKDIQIAGTSRNKSDTKKIIQEKIIDEELILNKKNLSTCNLLIIATPIDETMKIVMRLSNDISPNTLVMDVGSTKKSIADFVKKKHLHFQFILTHPMAGSELSGYTNSSPFLFQNKPWIICPNNANTKKHIDLVRQFVELLGAVPSYFDASSHDKLVSYASHLPSLIATILMQSVLDSNLWEEIKPLASSGFRDTTRLASQNVTMKKNICMTNKHNICDTLRIFEKNIKLFRHLLENNNSKELTHLIEKSKISRDEWLENIYN